MREYWVPFKYLPPYRLTPKRFPGLLRLFFVVPPPRLAEFLVWMAPPNEKTGRGDPIGTCDADWSDCLTKGARAARSIVYVCV